MKKIFLAVIALAMSIQAYAVPAKPTPSTVTLPDGTTVTVQIHGDEHFHYTTTADGYTVELGTDGFFRYAIKNAEGKLVASDVIARDVRTNSDYDFLKGIEKRLVDNAEMAEGQKRFATANQMYAEGLKKIDYNNFRGLVVLVEYNDCQFSVQNPQAFFSAQIASENFHSYTDINGATVQVNGSARDYFRDVSNSQFLPTFDVVGPVTIDYSVDYPGGQSSSTKLHNVAVAAARAAGEVADLSQYDANGDGVVDMMLFVYANSSAAADPSHPNHIWPYASEFYNTRVGGMKLGKFACTTELEGAASARMVTGIGVVAHEFSHVLGLPDMYDTSGRNQYVDVPGQWTVMCAGCYNNYSRSPSFYNAFESELVGFVENPRITEEGTYELRPRTTSYDGLCLPSPTSNVNFYFENHQNNSWDSALPGHGMLAFLVDRTNIYTWSSNAVNNDPNHPCYYLLRASSKSQTYTNDWAGDPFPGSGNKTALNNYTTPSLVNWNKKPSNLVLSEITEDADGVITLTVEKPKTLQSVTETFEDCPLVDVTSEPQTINGEFTTWTLDNKCALEANSEIGGKKAITTIKNSTLTSGELNYKMEYVNVSVLGKAAFGTRFQMQYSYDKGVTWVAADVSGSDDKELRAPKGVITAGQFILKNTAPVMLRFVQTTGSTSPRNIIDNVNILYDGEYPSAVDGIFSSAADRKVSQVFTTDGRLVGGEVPTESGIYVVRYNDGTATKIVK